MTKQNPNEKEEKVAANRPADAVSKAEKPTAPSGKERELTDEEIAAVAASGASEIVVPKTTDSASSKLF